MKILVKPGVLLIALITLWIISTGVATSAQQGYRNIIVFFIPGGGVEELKSVLDNTTQLKYQVFPLENPYNAPLDYYVYWLLSASKPSRTSIQLTSESINQSRIVYYWGNATLVDIPSVDPSIHPSAINPLVNLSSYSIPPAILRIPINGSIYWETLKTEVKSTLEGNTLKITLVAYNTSGSTTSPTSGKTIGPIAINTTETTGKKGSYRLLFYIVETTSNEVTLFFPGALATTGYASNGFTEFNDVFIYWFFLQEYKDLISKLDSNTMEWWFAQTAGSSIRFVRKALSESNNNVIYAYLPHLALIQELLGEEWYNKTAVNFYKVVVNELTGFANTLKPGYLAVIVLSSRNGDYVVYTSPQLKNEELLAPTSYPELIAILSTYSSRSVFNNYGSLRDSSELVDIKNQLNECQQNITQLNQTISGLQDRYSTCEAEKELYRIRVEDVDKTLQQARELEKTARQYLLIGLVVPIAISILLGFIAIRIAKMKHSE